MNRREALKATGGVLVAHRTAMLGFDLKPPTAKGDAVTGYVVFFDPKMMGKDWAAEARGGFPPGTVFYSVEVPKGKTLDDAVRIYTQE